jgi:hypothetical protein
VLNDDAYVIQTAALVVNNNNVALCPFARFLKAFSRAYRLLGVGAEILRHPGLGASYGMLELFGIVSSGALHMACEPHYEGAHISCWKCIFLSISSGL